MSKTINIRIPALLGIVAIAVVLGYGIRSRRGGAVAPNAVTLATKSLRPTAGGPMTPAAALLRRCRTAYDALQSYQGTTSVKATISMGAQGLMHNDTSADIKFLRPGRIWVSGTMMMATDRFTFLSDGHSTWEQFPMMDGGNWKRSESTEMALAKATGISEGAAASIPSILLQARCDYPEALSHPELTQGEIVHDTVNGRAALRVQADTKLGACTLWIDPKTLLLLRMRQRLDFSKVSLPSSLPPGTKQADQDTMKMAAQAMDSMKAGGGYADYDESFVDVHINPKFTNSTFARPTGAPA